MKSPVIGPSLHFSGAFWDAVLWQSFMVMVILTKPRRRPLPGFFLCPPVSSDEAPREDIQDAVPLSTQQWTGSRLAQCTKCRGALI